MRIARLAALLSLLAIAGTASATSSAGVSAPTGLHAFLLRADEPATTTFHRTPSFAWNPVPGATGYEFQLSTSSTFRENSIQYDTNGLTSPVAAPPIVLPWITGSPHGLYARVRATVTGGEVTPWGAPFGFDLVAPPPPTPLPSDPGLLRWTPLEGATAYQVWLIDVLAGPSPGGKKETVRTNVLDEREFYTFHQSSAWISTVRWRVRGIRSIAAGGPSNGPGVGNAAGGPSNGLPAVTYGAWSPIYQSTNPAPTGGSITLLHTISDVVSNGTANAPAQRLMPAFAWRGNQSLNGTPAELFRVYVFTDSQCLNLVYTSAVVGSPAYAPRPFGPLALPQDPAGIASARSSYLPDGTESNDYMYDGTTVTPQEQLPAAAATTTAPPDFEPASPPASSPSGTTGTSGTSGTTGTSSSTGTTSSSPAAPAGAPVDLWDTDYWPSTGYYWTVVPVAATSSGSGTSTIASPGASQGSTLVPVTDPTQFTVGESITIGVAPDSDTATITQIVGNIVTVGTALNFGHAVGEAVTTTSASGVIYRDLELPQDACAAGRVQRFGIGSEPTLMAADDPFVTGLSNTGHVVSAAGTPSFYGQPLVAWTPALGAEIYELEWSAAPDPFIAVGSLMTYSTSAVLSLPTGQWYYRVRGFDYNLPSGAQAMSWSDTAPLDISTPMFRVTKQPKTKFKVVGKSK